jgi:copper chaperone
MSTVTYLVPAISCSHCTRTIEMELKDLEGIQSVKAAVDTKVVEITFDKPANEEKIKSILAEIEYPVQGLITL